MTTQPPTLSPVLALLAVLAACNAAPPEPTADPSVSTSSTSTTSTGGVKQPGADARQQTQTQTQPRPVPPKPQKRKISARPVVQVPPSPGDPLAGKWTLDDAVKGLPAGKQLAATIETSLGTLECKLFDDKAPITVANFVGLARGLRPWKTPEDKWEKKPAYDGTLFHRIIKGFMIQGGDAKKNGTGEPGYVIPDEIWEDANHDRAGLLCMANRGKNTNGAQFFITDDAALHLDDGYTIFGECGPLEIVHKIAGVEVVGERPKTQVDIKKITIKGSPSPNADLHATAVGPRGGPQELQQLFRRLDCADGKTTLKPVTNFDPCKGSHLVLCSVPAREPTGEGELLRSGCTRASSNPGAIDYCCPALPDPK